MKWVKHCEFMLAVVMSLSLCYNIAMYNWSTDYKTIKKDPEKYAIWRLEQLINFGLGKEKISAMQLKAYWPKLKIDQHRKKFLSILLNDRNLR